MASSRSGLGGGSLQQFVWARATTSQSADLGPCGLPRDLLLRGATKCAARCRARALLLLPVLDGAFVGALGLQGEFALGLSHCVVGGPDRTPSLPARGAGRDLEPAHLLLRQRRPRERVVLAA